MIRPKTKKGSILVFAIWVLVLFSILGRGIYMIVSAQVKVTKRLQKILISQYLAKSACVYAGALKQNDETAYDTLYELRTEKQRELGKGRFIYTVVDEESKININKVSQDILSRIPGLNEWLAGQVINSRLRPFQVKEELLAIEGITKEVFDECRDFITVHGEGGVNINTASTQILEILGFDSYLSSTVDSYRKGADSQEITEDDGVFESAGGIISRLRMFGGLSQPQEDILSSLIGAGLLGVSSKNLSLQINTEIFDKPAMEYVIIIDSEEIKEWREY